MSESENERKGQEEKMCRLVKASMALSVIWCILFFFCFPPFPSFSFFTLQDVLLHFAFASIPSVLAILALLRIKMSSKKLAGRRRAIIALVLNFFVIFLPVVGHYLERSRIKLTQQMVCSANLRNIGCSILIYSDSFGGRYPASDKWFDLLMETDILEKQFLCKGAVRKGDKGSYHYAMNPNCESNSPSDIVLLFETKGGWNQFGGPEILTTENHNGRGCYVFFNNGRVEFIKTKHLDKLKWKADDDKPERAGSVSNTE